MDDSIRSRVDTVYRAVDLIDDASPDYLAACLVNAKIHAPFHRDHAKLRALLVADLTGFRLISAWKASQRLLKAAGLPY
jgi:hypothetical protein